MSDLNKNVAPVASPCISICVLDEDEVCRGCYRTGEEIRSWIIKTDLERTEILRIAGQRSRKENPFAGGGGE